MSNLSQPRENGQPPGYAGLETNADPSQSHGNNANLTTSSSNRRLPPNQQLVAAGKWPIIGERIPAPGIPQTLAISGFVTKPKTWSLNDLKVLPQARTTIDIHCVARWTKFDVTFEGVLLADLLIQAGVQSTAKYVSFVSHSARRHSTSLNLQTAIELQTLIAWQADGCPIGVDHGGPLRNIVPRKYFYKSVKWLVEIVLLAEDQLGYWEAESGYHNEADPWREQRYMAPTIDRRTAAALIESRDFSNRDLRSIDASKRELDGLVATHALLRDANFRDSRLRGADFTGANLSNAHFERADLRDTQFIAADLEGANFAGADMRGANLTNASLIGASFRSTAPDAFTAAVLDSTTIIPDNCLPPLTPDQYAFVQRCLFG